MGKQLSTNAKETLKITGIIYELISLHNKVRCNSVKIAEQ